MVERYCEYCRIPDADGDYDYDGRQLAVDSLSGQTALCTEVTSTVSGDRLYESDRDDCALDQRDECADWLTKTEMVSQVCGVCFVVIVFWVLFLVTVVLIVLLL